MKKPTSILILTGMLCAIAFSEEKETDVSTPVIRVTAQRFENTELAVPADITAITSEKIEQSQAQNVPELLQQEANIHVRSSNGKGNTGELSMRGFGEGSGLRVLVIVDGHKMNRADMGILDWQQLPLENIESIEVIRGGQSVLYGNHALSGVVKITTKKGGVEKIKLKAAAGSYGFQEYNAFYSGGASDLFYTAGLNYQRDEGFRDNSLSWSKNANLSLGCLLGDSDTITLKAAVGKNYIELPGPLSYDQYRSDPSQTVHPDDHFYTTNLLITALWEGERDWGSIQVNGGFNLRNIAFRMDTTTGNNEQQGFSFSPQTRIGNEKNFIIGGFDLFYDTLDFSGDQGTTFNDARLDRITAGPFLFAQKEIVKTLSFSGGARYECSRTKGNNRKYNKDDFIPFIYNPWGPPLPNPNYPPKPLPNTFFDDTTTKQGWAGELSLNWMPTDSLSAWIGYDRVYRYPALDETASYQGHAQTDPFNKNLDPETGNNFETGFKYRSECWTASATFFYLMLNNEIGYDPVNIQNVNLGATKHIGSDLDLSFDKKNYGASTMLSWVRATFDGGLNSGKTVPLVPEFQNTTQLWFRPVKPLRLTGTCTWLSEQFQGGDFDNTNPYKINAYALFGLRADWEIGEHLTLFAKIDNLTNKRYASSAYNDGFYPGQGRSFYAGASMEF